MTKEEFIEFIDETIPQALFHVESKDLDDTYGVRLDEVILLDLLHKNKEALKYENLAWFVQYFITNHDDYKNGQTKK